MQQWLLAVLGPNEEDSVTVRNSIADQKVRRRNVLDPFVALRSREILRSIRLGVVGPILTYNQRRLALQLRSQIAMTTSMPLDDLSLAELKTHEKPPRQTIKAVLFGRLLLPEAPG